jgi:hypothetical protein
MARRRLATIFLLAPPLSISAADFLDVMSYLTIITSSRWMATQGTKHFMSLLERRTPRAALSMSFKPKRLERKTESPLLSTAKSGIKRSPPMLVLPPRRR